MKYLFLSFFILFIVNTINAQNAFATTIFCKEEEAAISSVLGTRATDFNTYKKEIMNFDTAHYKKFIELIKEVKKKGNGDKSASSPLFLAPDFVAKLIDGVSQWLEKRVKKELSAAFLDKMVEQIDSITELKLLFPQTYRLFHSDALFLNSTYTKTWVETFKSDFKNIITNLKNTIVHCKNNNDCLFLKTNLMNDTIFTITNVFLEITGDVINKKHIVDIITDLGQKYGTESVPTDPIKKVIKALSLISDNLKRFDGGGNIWYNTISDWSYLTTEDEMLFSGLIYAQAPLFWEKILPNIKNQKDLFLNQIKSFLRITQQIENNIKKLQSINTNDSLARQNTIEIFENYTSTILDLIDCCENARLLMLGLTESDNSHNIYLRYKLIAQKLIALMQAIQSKEQSRIWLAATDIIFTIVYNGQSFCEQCQKNQALKIFLRFGNFISDIASAENAESFKVILDKYVAPVGSYRIKQKQPFTVSLNAYPGLYVGRERLFMANAEFSSVYGVTAPIGLAINFGLNKKGTAGDLSVFLSVIDIGAALAYRWNGTTNNTPQGFPDSLRWQQIFSPGGFLIYGIPKTPLAIMAGVQYTPLLRSINNGQGVFDPKNAMRLSLALTVDIPVIYLFKGKR